MGRYIVVLPDGSCATESEALSALALEAKRRGISYGQLVSSTAEWERTEIIRRYCVERRKTGRRTRK